MANNQPNVCAFGGRSDKALKARYRLGKEVWRDLLYNISNNDIHLAELPGSIQRTDRSTERDL